MPDEVPVSQARVGGEERDTRHVGKASRTEQQQALLRNSLEERPERDQEGYLPAVGDQDQWRIGGTASPACFFCCLIALFSFGDCWGFFFCCFGG
jgi:hypothetical protein